jgi:hypothetical protein
MLEEGREATLLPSLLRLTRYRSHSVGVQVKLPPYVREVCSLEPSFLRARQLLKTVFFF